MQYLAFGPHLAQLAAVTVGACAVASFAAYPSILRRDLAGAARTASRVLLVVATLAILYVTLRGTTSMSRSLNLLPGAGIAASFDTSSPDEARNALENVIGNVMLFVPFGFLAVFALRRNVLVVTVLAGALSVLIETTQLLLGDRWSDIDDVMLNSTGALLGAVVAARLAAGVARRLKEHSQVKPEAT